MRPLRLLLSLASSLVAITLLLYIAFSLHEEQIQSSPTTTTKGKMKAFFSFTSPASLFPPSAIISLTDDNSTFFLARPANFGPLLPTKGLSGPLWVGNGFGDEALGKGELGCSDVPDWDNDDQNTVTGSKVAQGNIPAKFGSIRGSTRTERTPSEDRIDIATEDNGTDDHSHHQPLASRISETIDGKASENAEIRLLQEHSEIKGKVVLLKRGGCGFLEKTKWTQRRGGVALIVGDDVRGGALIVMNAHGDTSNITIPAIFTSYTTAHLLSSLLSSGGSAQDLSPEDATKLKLIKSRKASKHSKIKNKPRNSKAQANPISTQGSTVVSRASGVSEALTRSTNEEIEKTSWIRVFANAFGFGNHGHAAPKRDPGLLQLRTSAGVTSQASKNPNEEKESNKKDGKILPSNSEYDKYSQPLGSKYTIKDGESHKTWLGNFLSQSNSDLADTEHMRTDGSGPSSVHAQGHDESPDEPGKHEGLWVTLAPTNMSSSPFFDTLLVLVVSPLVTLTVVYALLLLRSRIRRRRWRAPKSVVERLPVRTYHTISDASSSPTATPNASSPTTPLLQHSPSRPASSPTRPQPRAPSEVPATSSAVQQSSRPTEEEKREAGLAEWRRRYGGRQKECVVCLEEYVDGISRVMSLPCGHEFHADCITPWLVTRRRTCPICKGDVVRSLSQSYRDRSLRSPSPARPARFSNEPDSLQAQAAETRNDSPSASRPVPVSSSSAPDFRDNFDADVEANWAGEATEEMEGQGREIPGSRSGDLNSSVRDLRSTVTTTIWRGFEAVRSVAGLQRRHSQGEVDRDR